MAHQESPIQPELAEMSIEEKWGRLHDFSTLDHAIIYKMHKRLGTVKERVDDTVEAHGSMIGILPTEVTWEEGGCVWTFKVK